MKTYTKKIGCLFDAIVTFVYFKSRHFVSWIHAGDMGTIHMLNIYCRYLTHTKFHLLCGHFSIPTSITRDHWAAPPPCKSAGKSCEVCVKYMLSFSVAVNAKESNCKLGNRAIERL